MILLPQARPHVSIVIRDSCSGDPSPLNYSIIDSDSLAPSERQPPVSLHVIKLFDGGKRWTIVLRAACVMHRIFKGEVYRFISNKKMLREDRWWGAVVRAAA